jgi:hypothetical protein
VGVGRGRGWIEETVFNVYAELFLFYTYNFRIGFHKAIYALCLKFAL